MTLSRITAVERQARRLMDKYGLTDWDFEWTNLTQMVGDCSHPLKTIRLSRPYVEHDPDNGKGTTNCLLHEISHALVGPDVPSHGKVWKAKCIEIGAEPIAQCGGEGSTFHWPNTNEYIRQRRYGASGAKPSQPIMCEVPQQKKGDIVKGYEILGVTNGRYRVIHDGVKGTIAFAALDNDTTVRIVSNDGTVIPKYLDNPDTATGGFILNPDLAES
jgi:hypothetical protein